MKHFPVFRWIFEILHCISKFHNFQVFIPPIFAEPLMMSCRTVVGKHSSKVQRIPNLTTVPSKSSAIHPLTHTHYLVRCFVIRVAGPRSKCKIGVYCKNCRALQSLCSVVPQFYFFSFISSLPLNGEGDHSTTANPCPMLRVTIIIYTIFAILFADRKIFYKHITVMTKSILWMNIILIFFQEFTKNFIIYSHFYLAVP